MQVVRKVSLRNFRCHEEFDFKCDGLTSLIVGRNGSGKTSILEAIYLSLRGKSFKGVDSEILRKGADFYRVELESDDFSENIVRFDGRKKNFEVDGKKSLLLPRAKRYPIVLFEPDDLYLVASSPTRRRDYFDNFLKQIDGGYTNLLGKYNKALRQRNDLLKNEYFDENDLFSWNILCAHYGAELRERRRKMIDVVNADLMEIYRGISENLDECSIEYLGEVVDENQYLKRLEQNLAKDRVLAHTSYGVHRDDYAFIFNGKRANGSASRGEVRSIVLALKFIEAKILEAETAKKPIVLLDDIFSELDEGRQRQLMTNFKDYQMIITSTAAPAGMQADLVL